MRQTLLVATLAVSLLPLAPLAAAHHTDNLHAFGLAVAGATAYTAHFDFSPTFSSARMVLRDGVTHAIVQDVAFSASYTQTGLDDDPVPEAFERHIFSTTGGVSFDVEGAFAQYEAQPTPPLAFGHAYVGHYQAYQVVLVGVFAGSSWLDPL